MDWKTLFTSPDGRIGRKDFWVATGLLLAANVVLGMIPLIGAVVSLASIYFGVCVSSKRLHDFGATGWLASVPYVAVAAGLGVIVAFSGAALIAAIASGDGAVASAAAFAGVGVAGLVVLTIMLICLGFILWVGLSRGAAGDNRYGPHPEPLVTAI